METNTFQPKFYWTGNFFEDATRINAPHIKKEGLEEDRTVKTLELLNDLSDFKEFTLTDVFNIQNQFLKENNHKGIKPGLRTHNVSFSKDEKTSDTPDFTVVPEEINKLFPVKVFSTKAELLEFYRKVQMVHPLSDLNGRVFGIIVSILYKHLLKSR